MRAEDITNRRRNIAAIDRGAAPRLIKLGAVLVFALAFVLPHPLFAQGCALCYAQAAGSTQRFIQALRSGILILVIPPMVLSIMFSVMAYRRRYTFNPDVSQEPEAGGDAPTPGTFSSQ